MFNYLCYMYCMENKKKNEKYPFDENDIKQK